VVTVAFDATPLLGDRTGVGNAVTGWLGELAGRPDLSMRAYGLTGAGWRGLPPLLPGGVVPPRLPLPAGVMLRLWARVDLPPVEWATGAVQVVHGTNFVLPPSRRAARVVSVWDLTCVRFPELCTPTALRYPALIARAVAAGATVHVTARAVADEVIEHFGAERDRVVVVPPGIHPAPLFSPPAASPPATPAPYVLALGTTEPRKDLPGLVAAFDRMAGAHPDLELRIAGPVGWGEEALGQAIATAAHRDRIRRLGWVADRHALLAGATVFAYPSRYEGFGFPPLEAMAAGVPVVSTSTGSIPEVLGDAASLVPVGDVDALAGALERVVVDADERRRLIAAGTARVARYSWARAADGLADLYRRLGAG
jgi:glycosyltransferase involved in cell wall biosynthesis